MQLSQLTEDIARTIRQQKTLSLFPYLYITGYHPDITQLRHSVVDKNTVATPVLIFFLFSLADCCVHLPVSQLLEHWLETPHCPRNRRPPLSAAGDGASDNGGGGASANGGGGASANGVGARDNGVGASDAAGDGASDNGDGGGPLHTLLRNLPACLDGVEDMVRLLLEAGTDVSSQGRVSPTSTRIFAAKHFFKVVFFIRPNFFRRNFILQMTVPYTVDSYSGSLGVF